MSYTNISINAGVIQITQKNFNESLNNQLIDDRGKLDNEEELVIQGPYGLITICKPIREPTKSEIQQFYRFILEIIINKVLSEEKSLLS